MDALVNRLFIEPAVGKGYPIDGWKLLENIYKYVQPGDEEKLKIDYDFIGIQNYTRIMVRHGLWPPILWANQVKPKSCRPRRYYRYGLGGISRGHSSGIETVCGLPWRGQDNSNRERCRFP